MAQELQNITIGSPGFFGLNTEDSSIGLNQNFATIADNAVIDPYGRLGSRKGFLNVTATRTELDAGTSDFVPLETVHVFEDDAGNTKIFGAGNNKLLSTTGGPTDYVLTDVTPAEYSITANTWCIVNFNDYVYFFQEGHNPLYYTNGGSVTLNTDAPVGAFALAAFGKLWVAGVAASPSMLYWSDSLDGTDFSTGSSGSIDLKTVWPDGYDEITGIAAYNDFLIIFGRNSIVAYSGAETPGSMALADTISGVGCVSWKTIQETGNELLYLSRTGLRSFSRTVQGGALPVSDVSNNIRTDLINAVAATGGDISLIDSVFSPEEAFYVVLFRNASTYTSTAYCFDLRTPLQDGTFRATRWPGSHFYSFHNFEGTLYCGNEYGLGVYSGYQDTGAADTDYRLKLYSVVLTFDNPDRLKFLKQIRTVFISDSASNATVYWGYGFSGVFSSQTITLTAGSLSEFGVSEFGEDGDEFSGGTTFSNPKVKATGSGSNITIGVEATIDGGSVSIQEINVQTLMGRLQ